MFGSDGGSITRTFEDATGFEISLREVKQIKKTDAYAQLRSITYKGEHRNVFAHVKGKGFKKGEALRVHFFADYDEKRIVITHCGEHLATFDTPSL